MAAATCSSLSPSMLRQWSVQARMTSVVPSGRETSAYAKISTSHVERQNLNIRMGNRRFTRLTNAFSKKLDNHGHSLSLYFFYYNFCRIHKSLKVTPAMAAGVSDHLMDMSDLVRLVDLMEEPAKPRGPYKKKAA